MQVKIHESYRRIVAVCDTNLVGQLLSEGKRQIEIRPTFFKGEEKSRKEVIKILKDLAKEDATFNIVGKESVETALESGIIQKHGVIEINNTPIALVLM